MTDDAQMPPGRRRVGLVATLGALSAFGPLSMDLYLPALPDLGRDLDAGDATAQLTMSLCMVGLAVGQLFAGPLSDQIGRRRPLLAGVAVYTVVSLLCASASDIRLLIALRLVQGLAGAAGLVIARAMVRDLFEGDKAVRVFSSLMMISGLAPVLAPLAGGQLARLTDWRGMFVVLAAIGVLLLLAAFRLPETLPPGERRSGGMREAAAQIAVLGRDRRFAGYALVLGLASCALFVYISLGSFVLQDEYGLSAQWFSVVFAVNSLSIVLASNLNRAVLRLIRPHRMLLCGIGVALAGAAVAALAVLAGWGLPGLLPGLFLVVFSMGVTMPNATALALDGHARRAGSASALVGMLQFLIGAVVPPVISSGGTTASVMVAGIAGSAVLALAALLVSARASARPAGSEPAAEPEALNPTSR